MKNREYYKNEIYEVACRRDRFAVNKVTRKVDGCLNLLCSDCLFCPSSDRYGNCACRALDWLEQEYVEPILDDTEKQYLEHFIRPFRGRVRSITKLLYADIYAFLQLRMEDSDICWPEGEVINLPLFVRNSMYRHMVSEKEYTLKELGLFEDEED